MKAFAELFAELESQKNKGKIAALARFFEQAEPEDAAWALHLLNEGKSPTRISGARMREAVSRLDWFAALAHRRVLRHGRGFGGNLRAVIAFARPIRTTLASLDCGAGRAQSTANG